MANKKTTREKPKAKGGRPTKYKPEYCELMVERGKQGKHMVQIASEIGVHIDTIHEWCDKHPPFSEAKKLSKQHCEAFWTNVLTQTAINGDFGVGRAPTLMFKMKACFGWRDRDPNQVNIDANTKGEATFNFSSVPDSEFKPGDDE